jgi:hypothetical protein
MAKPSTAHQTLVMWAIRKMQADGFIPMAYDGNVPQFDCERRLHYPPNLEGLRPDALAFSPVMGSFAFGEAKIEDDLDSDHTRQQFRRYAAIISDSSLSRSAIYVATPRSAALALDRLLRDVGLISARHVSRLHIPDCLIEERTSAHA